MNLDRFLSSIPIKTNGSLCFNEKAKKFEVRPKSPSPIDLATIDTLLERSIKKVSEEEKTATIQKMREAARKLGDWPEGAELKEHLLAYASQLGAKKKLSSKTEKAIRAYIQDNQSTLFSGEKTYFRPSETGLRYTLQVIDRQVIVHTRNSAPTSDMRDQPTRTVTLGRGQFKRVRESVLFKEGAPLRYIATPTSKPIYPEDRTLALEIAQEEAKILSEFRGKRGVVQLIAATHYVGKDGAEVKFNLPQEKATSDLYGELIKGDYSKEDEKNWTLDLLHGLLAVHSAGYVHADINLVNIIIGDTAMLADFGLAYKDSDAIVDRDRGSDDYMAPEILRFRLNPTEENKMRIGPAVDIYSLGVVLYDIFYRGGLPEYIIQDFDSRNMVQAKQVLDNLEIFQAKVSGQKNSARSAFVFRMLSPNPEERPTAEEALSFFENYYS